MPRPIPAQGEEEGKKREKHPKDPNLLLAYRLTDLEKVLPWAGRTLTEWEGMGLFPKGSAPHPEGQKVWPRKLVLAWLEILGEKGMEQLPSIAEKIRQARAS